MKKIMLATLALLFTGALATAQQQPLSDEGGRVLALEKAWNFALEEKNSKALDMLLANTMVSHLPPSLLTTHPLPVGTRV